MTRKRRPRRRSAAPLNKHVFVGSGSFFNCGGIALCSRDVIRYVRKGLGDRGWNDMLAGLTGSLAARFAPEQDEGALLSRNIHLYHNTTGAVQRVLFTVLRKLHGNVSLLTTDFEYPGCVAALDDYWRGTISMVELARYLYEGQETDACETLKRAFLTVQPRIVYISHVSRYTGFVVPPGLLRFFHEENPRCTIILDGSQGLGNVVVTAELLREVDFYIASGHKWLGGHPALGIVWVRDPDFWPIADRAQSTSFDSTQGGTANHIALLSTEKALEDLPANKLINVQVSNRRLASRFLKQVEASSRLKRGGLKPVGGTPKSGLVSLSVPSNLVEAVKSAVRLLAGC